MTVDFGRTADDYARHRRGFPPSFFDQVLADCGRPRRVLDLGTGTGTVARGFAARRIPVVALDRAESLLRAAREVWRTEVGPGPSPGLHAVVAFAEELPFAAASFDLVCAAQCWHWFDEAAALEAVTRVLAPGGRLLLASLDWLPLPANLVEATEALIREHNPAWSMHGGDGRHPEHVEALRRGGYREVRVGSEEIALEYTPASWRGRIRASAGVSASLPPDAVARFDAELERLLRDRFPGESWPVPHRIHVVHGVRPEIEG